MNRLGRGPPGQLARLRGQDLGMIERSRPAAEVLAEIAADAQRVLEGAERLIP